jgi:hypothetical protein
MTPQEALVVMEHPFVIESVASEAIAVADSLMTPNQKALMAQFDGLPFRDKLLKRSLYRKAILRNFIKGGN